MTQKSCDGVLYCINHLNTWCFPVIKHPIEPTPTLLGSQFPAYTGPRFSCALLGHPAEVSYSFSNTI